MYLIIILVFSVQRMAAKKTIKKGFRTSIGWNLGKKNRSIHLLEPLTSTPIIGTNTKEIKETKKNIIEYFINWSLFKEENLRANYKAAQLPRENEYKVTYNVVEGESLQSRFGQDYDLSTTLNNIYIGLATFLATTFIEVAYTFKKVDAQKLTPEQVTPANLAFAAGTNVINAVAGMGIEQITTAGYYPSDYLDSYGTEAYRVPEPPAGGFYDYDYYTRMADMVLEPTEDGGDMTDASALADDLGSMY